MGSTATLYVIIFMAAGAAAGWHFRRAQAANADLKVHKARIPGFRRVRARSGLTSIALIVLTLLALRALIRLPGPAGPAGGPPARPAP